MVFNVNAVPPLAEISAGQGFYTLFEVSVHG